MSLQRHKTSPHQHKMSPQQHNMSLQQHKMSFQHCKMSTGEHKMSAWNTSYPSSDSKNVLHSRITSTCAVLWPTRTWWFSEQVVLFLRIEVFLGSAHMANATCGCMFWQRPNEGNLKEHISQQGIILVEETSPV
jgi:hypothetical protein